MTNDQWAYAAGFIDGEGCLRVKWKSARRHSAGITVAQIDRRPLDLMVEWFGGGIRIEQTVYGPKPRWTLSRKEHLIPALQGMMPYFVVKREQAVVMLEFLEAEREDEYAMLNLDRIMGWLKTREAFQ